MHGTVVCFLSSHILPFLSFVPVPTAVPEVTVLQVHTMADSRH